MQRPSTQLLVGPEGAAKNRGEYRHCDVCGIELNSAIVAKAHYAGKNHQKKLKALALLKSNQGKMVVITCEREGHLTKTVCS